MRQNGRTVVAISLDRTTEHGQLAAAPRAGLGGKVQPWTDAQVAAVCDAHPGHLRLLPEIMTGCGLRVAEALALAAGDIDFDEKMLHVRRQLKRLGREHVYALPKNDRERDVPLPDWAAAAVRAHLTGHPAWACTLPWEKAAGEPQTHSLVFRWADGSYVRYRNYSETAWKPALVAAGIIARPVTDSRHRPHYQTTSKEGPHHLRHYYASLHGGVSVKELAEYLGHHDPAFTLRVYSHLIDGSHERARQVFDARLFRPRAVADGT